MGVGFGFNLYLTLRSEASRRVATFTALAKSHVSNDFRHVLRVATVRDGPRRCAPQGEVGV